MQSPFNLIALIWLSIILTGCGSTPDSLSGSSSDPQYCTNQSTKSAYNNIKQKLAKCYSSIQGTGVATSGNVSVPISLSTALFVGGNYKANGVSSVHLSADGGMGTRLYGLNVKIRNTGKASCRTSVTVNSFNFALGELWSKHQKMARRWRTLLSFLAYDEAIAAERIKPKAAV